jgi:hypothetical protein
MNMKELHARVRNVAVMLAGAVCLVAVIPDPAFAQRDRTPPTSVERREEQLNRQANEYERDKLNRELKEEPNKPGNQRRTHARAAQIEQDFEALQAGYNQIVIAMVVKKDLNHHTVLAAVAEINKCSTRLRGGLALPKSEDKREKDVPSETDNGKIEDSMLRLREVIYSFVTNPLFETKAVLDIRQAEKASRDLDKIIELSERIRKTADKLKTPKPAAAKLRA